VGVLFKQDARLKPDGVQADIRLWDVATGKERQAFPADSFATGSLAFAPDGKSLAWANSSGLIRIWDLRTGKPSPGHEGHQGVVTSVASTECSKTLITAGADASIRFWETEPAVGRCGTPGALEQMFTTWDAPAFLFDRIPLSRLSGVAPCRNCSWRVLSPDR
jgi:WD40 repeat protein